MHPGPLCVSAIECSYHFANQFRQFLQTMDIRKSADAIVVFSKQMNLTGFLFYNQARFSNNEIDLVRVF